MVAPPRKVRNELKRRAHRHFGDERYAYVVKYRDHWEVSPRFPSSGVYAEEDPRALKRAERVATPRELFQRFAQALIDAALQAARLLFARCAAPSLKEP